MLAGAFLTLAPAVPILPIPVLPAHAASETVDPQRTEILDNLFEKLAEADSEQTADLVAASIWRIWSDSGSDTVNLLLARSLEAIQDEDYELALQILDEVVQLAPGFAEGWNKRATVHFKLKHYGASIHDIQRTLIIEPRHFSAMAGLGTMLKQTGRQKAALEVFRRALALHPQLESARKAIRELAVEVEGRDI
ncbi:MAG: tetratricopeptide repeat protein [Rhizobiales bacterium]|nr:tetratricopeptide repeat protein [Hyphomicrobiales bacterium]